MSVYSVDQSCLTLCDPMTVAHQAPLSWDFPGKNTGVDPGVEPESPESLALAGGVFTIEPPGNPNLIDIHSQR